MNPPRSSRSQPAEEAASATPSASVSPSERMTAASSTVMGSPAIDAVVTSSRPASSSSSRERSGTSSAPVVSIRTPWSLAAAAMDSSHQRSSSSGGRWAMTINRTPSGRVMRWRSNPSEVGSAHCASSRSTACGLPPAASDEASIPNSTAMAPGRDLAGSRPAVLLRPINPACPMASTTGPAAPIGDCASTTTTPGAADSNASVRCRSREGSPVTSMVIHPLSRCRSKLTAGRRRSVGLQRFNIVG